jgi:hypothetical protein
MLVSHETERLAAGLAFSDNLGLGVKFNYNKKLQLKLSVFIRHESNANLKFPNSGHNSAGIRIGTFFN